MGTQTARVRWQIGSSLERSGRARTIISIAWLMRSRCYACASSATLMIGKE
jgi:hypothetical protein